MRIALTGGIACGKSLAAGYLRELGFETIDADDIVHRLVPAGERRRLAKTVFRDEKARRALEARIHPPVRAAIDEFLSRPGRRIAVVPLLFEVRWDENYDIICCVKSEKEKQILRMTTTRGYTREEAEARLAAQMPVEEKAAKSHYVIENDGSAEELKASVAAFARWLERRTEKQT
ncbi:MAG: dephospho-CoA kinase, partial [Kiritimatiellae bacterium]|nr:dephospho-CoA kinase [Kiritimatiellia bacterium]